MYANAAISEAEASGKAKLPTRVADYATSAATITAGLVDRASLAACLGRSERTVIRWEHAGLPVIKLGKTRLYDPAKARDWLMSYERRHDAPKRGRPAKRHAA